MSQKRNLVVLHLESLCVPMLQRGASLPSIQKMAEEGISFERFFSSATSSLMAISDMMAGHGAALDHVFNFDNPDNRPKRQRPHLFETLEAAGYRAQGFGYPPIWRDDLNGWKLWGDLKEEFHWCDSHDEFLASVDKAIVPDDSGQPFAVYVWDQRSHLSYSDEMKPTDTPGFARIPQGHHCIDHTVNFVRECIEKRGLLDNTLVVAFGDHGDQMWSRGIYFGFAHGFEPYTELIWTPAFFWGAGIQPETKSDLASLVDLAPTTLKLLGFDVVKNTEPNAGIDLFSQRRTHAFAQNLFTNQGPNKALPKGFSVTDDAWHLVLSEHGLELFFYPLDPGNQTNLLWFFELNEDGTLQFAPGDVTHGHFRNTLNPAQVTEIQERFYKLRGALAELLTAKAASIVDGTFDASAFLRIRPPGVTVNLDHRELVNQEARTKSMQEFVSRTGPYAELS